MAELRWANVERLTVTWLRSRLPSTVTVLTQTDDNLAALAAAGGVVRVERAGGVPGSELDRDRDVELGVYAASRAALWALVQDVEQAMGALAGEAPDDGAGPAYVDDVSETFGFAKEPYPNPAVAYAVATFTLTIRPL